MGFRGQYRNKRDANEPAIVEALRAAGLSVVSMDTPADLLIGYGGCTYIAEIKAAKGKLTKSQAAFYVTWQGNVTVLRSVDDALAFAKEVRAEKRSPPE